MRIEETCGCGASFSTNHKHGVRFWREWRRSHTCQPQAQPAQDPTFNGSNAQVEVAPSVYQPELHIGFRAFPDGDED
jgi:hypothetical protein